MALAAITARLSRDLLDDADDCFEHLEVRNRLLFSENMEVRSSFFNWSAAMFSFSNWSVSRLV